MADYKAKNNIVAADGRLMNEQQLSEINSQLATARAATAEAKARLDRIEDVLKQLLPDASTAEALHNEIIVRLRQQILDLQARQQLFTARYGAKHQATLNIQEQVAGMQRSIADEMGKVAESARSDYAVAQAREQALTASLDSSVTQAASTNQSMVRLRELQSNAQSSRTLYESFLQRYMDAVQQETYPATEARLITPAVPPASPYKPSHVGIVGASLIGGLLVAFGVATLRELLDGVFRSAVQVERSVGLNCLATLPRLKSGKPSRTALAARALPAEPPSPREITRPPPLHRFVIDEPFSPFAEGLRAVKIAIDLANMGKSHTVVGIASTLPNEGKSTIAANLAQMIAHAGSRVLLVDAELRSPSLSRLLAPGAEGGLIDVVAGRRPLAELIRVDSTSQLDFLPAGAPHKLLHTNEILAAESMRAFFAAARNHYDYIVVDLSPLAPVVDARATTQFIDGYIFAVEWGTTKIDVVETVLKDAREIYDATLGIVLNKADLAVLGRYDRHRGAGYPQEVLQEVWVSGVSALAQAELAIVPSSGHARDHMPCLDGFRGLAAVMMVLGHAGDFGLPSGIDGGASHCGVLIFFALSGIFDGRSVSHELTNAFTDQSLRRGTDRAHRANLLPRCVHGLRDPLGRPGLRLRHYARSADPPSHIQRQHVGVLVDRPRSAVLCRFRRTLAPAWPPEQQ